MLWVVVNITGFQAKLQLGHWIFGCWSTGTITLGIY
jgi:hypothetical protein